MTTVRKRLARELRECMIAPSDYFSVWPKDEGFMVWEGRIRNLPDARHAGKEYSLEIRFSENYPFRPPVMRFTSRVKCENILRNGDICMDILYDEWSPAFTISKLMYCVTSLLTDTPVTGLSNKEVNTFLEEIRQKRAERDRLLARVNTEENYTVQVNRTIPENIIESRQERSVRPVQQVQQQPLQQQAQKRKRRTELDMLAL